LKSKSILTGIALLWVVYCLTLIGYHLWAVGSMLGSMLLSASPIIFVIYFTLRLGKSKSGLGRHYATILAIISVSLLLYVPQTQRNLNKYADNKIEKIERRLEEFANTNYRFPKSLKEINYKFRSNAYPLNPFVKIRYHLKGHTFQLYFYEFYNERAYSRECKCTYIEELL
jgi:hypothetical protein